MRLATLALLLAILAVADPSAQVRRRASVVRAFEIATGYPHGRAGYVVDHIFPLCAGGADRPANMQWQAVAEAKVKDVDEKRLCARLRAFRTRWIPPLPVTP
jgi:hypothetical protein